VINITSDISRSIMIASDPQDSPIIELPEGFEATRMEQASTKRLEVNNSLINFSYTGTYGSFSENVWKG
jgi:hypothetical protein